jgi:ribosomal protein L11 methyltransferase
MVDSIRGNRHNKRMENPEFSLELVAGSDAFGDGGHSSTQLALQAMAALSVEHDFRYILDMGCGSGLLAMTAAHLWPQSRVMAVDIEPKAVELANRNIDHNGFSDRITVLRSDGYRHEKLSTFAPYDLILCNITADQILHIASGVGQVMASDGVLLLSGVLLWRSEEVLAIHAQLGLVPVLPTLSRDGWEAHVLSAAKSAD